MASKTAVPYLPFSGDPRVLESTSTMCQGTLVTELRDYPKIRATAHGGFRLYFPGRIGTLRAQPPHL